MATKGEAGEREKPGISTVKRLVCARLARVGPFSTVGAHPSLPRISHCFGCSPRWHTTSCLLPPRPEEEPSRYQGMIALGA